MNNSYCIDNLWKLHSSYSVQQAAALIAGFDPNHVVFKGDYAKYFQYEGGLTSDDGINKVQTAFSALINAITDKSLNAKLKHGAFPRYEGGYDNLRYHDDKNLVTDPVNNEDFLVIPTPNWSESLISHDDLKQWLLLRNFKPDFF